MEGGGTFGMEIVIFIPDDQKIASIYFSYGAFVFFMQERPSFNG